MIPKMFHVKHFGKVEAENLTRLETSVRLAKRKTGGFFGKIEGEFPGPFQ
jgi:hypothetical protein